MESWVSHIEFIALLVTLIRGFYLLDGKIERQRSMADRLYEMFIDLLTQEKNKGK